MNLELGHTINDNKYQYERKSLERPKIGYETLDFGRTDTGFVIYKLHDRWYGYSTNEWHRRIFIFLFSFFYNKVLIYRL